MLKFKVENLCGIQWMTTREMVESAVGSSESGQLESIKETIYNLVSVLTKLIECLAISNTLKPGDLEVILNCYEVMHIIEIEKE